ncbi:MAG TPA: FtsX-like permease family protein, partial [Gemmatimonadaceae bacterium]|nr:FtsX-like permease family protein [Gemmatimonadaceae bacterium]
APKITIVGVVRSARHDGPNQPYKNELFLPLEQFPARRISVLLDPAADAASAMSAFRTTLSAVDPLIPAGAAQSLEQIAGNAVALPRLYALLVAAFAAVALLLAVLGVYGVIAYAVAQRQREIGVRLALGARPSAIRAMVLGEGGQLAALGVLVGLGASVALAQLLRSLLFGVTPFDAMTFVVSAAVLAVMTIAASWLPARRAMKLDPASAIRAEGS